MGLTKKYGQPFSYSEGDTRAKSNTRFSRAFFDFLVTLIHFHNVIIQQRQQYTTPSSLFRRFDTVTPLKKGVNELIAHIIASQTPQTASSPESATILPH